MCPVSRTQWDLDEIPQSMREYFEEFETTCGAPWARVIDTKVVGIARNEGGNIVCLLRSRTSYD